MKDIYNFLDYSFDSQNHCLSKAGQSIEITSTTYKLLLFFIQNPAITLSRKTITEHVWSNRIVADTSLDKLIQRLRKLLGDTKPQKTIIATIHGEGFIFLPEVKKQSELKKNHTEINKTSKNKFKYLLLIFVIVFILIYFNKTDDLTNEIPIFSQAQAQVHVLSLVPHIDSTTNNNYKWITIGGMHYLNDKFKGAIGLKTYPISLKTLSTQDPERFAVELSNKKRSDSIILISTKELNQEFIADVKIRNSGGILSEKSFTSTSVKSLYDDIYQWALDLLKIEQAQANSSFEKTMSDNRYAVENYIRGISAQVTGDDQQAIKYFELATDEDPKFWLAWYQLSVSYRKQAKYQKAMSIINAFDNALIDEDFSLMLMNSQVNIYNAMGEFKQAMTTVDLALSRAKISKNLERQSILLANKSFTAGQLSQFDIALASIKESIELLDEKDYNGLGRSYSTLSQLQRNMGDIDKALESANKAIEYMQKVGDKRYVAKIKLRLSSIAAKQGQWEKAENLVEEALLTFNELNVSLEESTAYMRIIDYQLLSGKIDLALKNHNKLSDMMTSISSKNQKMYYQITTADVMLLSNHLNRAKDAINKMKDKTLSDYQLMNFYLLSMRYYLKTQDLDNWKKNATEFVEITRFESNPLVYVTQAQLAIKDKNFDLAIDAFEQAKEQALKYNSIRVADKVFNPYIEFLTQQNQLEKAQSILLELEKFNVPAYPYNKIKAKLLIKQGKIFKAITLLQELKAKSIGLWSIDDQLMLEDFKNLN